jgi:hypothetical protein
MKTNIDLPIKPKQPPQNVYIHVIRNLCIGLFFIVIALLCGMLGYHKLESMPWVDAFLNAAMILSGMGPAGTMVTSSGKIFAGCYALFSGLVFIAIAAIIFSPIIHQFFRRIHVEINKSDTLD